MSLKDFEIIKELGKGAFGCVWTVKRKEDGQKYAMKRVKISALDPKERENALNEVRILASLHNINIVAYKEAFYDEESKTLNIVLEFADDGDLESKIQKNIKSRSTFNENDIWNNLIQIIQGLKYLHDNKIMHRDIKCANIFMNKNGVLKLGDLNVSKIAKMGLATTQTGTPYYASPEVWADKPYDYKSDIWSVGCVVYEICTLRPPFRGTSLEQLSRNVRKGIYEPIPNTFSKDLSFIVGLLLQTNPFSRPSCDFLLGNEIIQRKMKELKLTGDKYDGEKKMPINLLNTIKMPRDVKEINQRLPKKKNYNRDIEETNLMEYDVNINRKQVDLQNELNAKENKININSNKVAESKEIQLKNKEILLNNLIKMKENNPREVIIKNNNPYDLIPNQKVINNNVGNQNINLRGNNNANNYYSNKNERNIINGVNAVVRPPSGKSDGRPKTPIQQSSNQKNDVRNILNNNNHLIQNNVLNKNKPVQLLAGLDAYNHNSNNNANNANKLAANQNNRINLMKMEGVNLVQARIEHASNKNKELPSRPQSANVNNHHHVILNQGKVNNLINNNKNQQEPSKIRANIGGINNPSDRAKSPNLIVRRNINIPLSANSPRQKSPVKEKYLSNQPSIKVNQILNKPVIKLQDYNSNNINLIGNNRNEIQRNNFDLIKLNQNSDQKKNINYHYVGSSNENVKGVFMKDNLLKEKLMANNKNNPLLAKANENIQHYQHLLNRPNSNSNHGPKIMVINQRK